ncbi:RagB/SusD family nutrient uptake outer membrane protein [Hymenobacter humi]|uniref:RagB/SusD family nutrient uptake outer membrane protein n=1 Tax=Hymenobacter humi TaxID=1411620 RepID=A0ABW2U3B3_9BACT
MPELDNSNLYGTNLILVPELMAADNYITFQGTFANLRDISRRLTKVDNTTAEGIWREAYQAINQANLVLDALPVVTSATSKATFEGEARFIRGDMYFELVRLFAKQYNATTAQSDLGVPINLTPVRTVEEANRKVARSTVAQVYAQVIDDLTKAVALLPKTNGTRATRDAAKALLARVYLQQSNFAQALTLSDDVIKTSGRSLAPTVGAVFTGRNTSESLFEIQQNDQNNAGTANAGLATHFASIGQARPGRRTGRCAFCQPVWAERCSWDGSTTLQ